MKTNGKTVYPVTSLTAEEATAAQLPWFVRDHWKIETMHHVPNTPSQGTPPWAGSPPRGRTTWRNLTIGALRTAGVKNIAAVHRLPRNPQHRMIAPRHHTTALKPAIGLPQILHEVPAEYSGESYRTVSPEIPLPHPTSDHVALPQ